jgi:phosphoenolpyruvate-protein phosphotransferase/dihydroxyacetone kinase phosphotransfer subunit
MVGIVLVSHSAKLAAGVAELAREMGGAVPLEWVGGLDLPDRPLGTDAALVREAIERAWSDSGVLVLMDLGSAVLSTEMALGMLPEDRRDRVVLSEAPFVEGAVAAAVAARLGRPLAEVAEEARGGLTPKATHLGAPRDGGLSAEAETAPNATAEALRMRLRIENPLGLHARPAARFVQTAASFQADVRVKNLTTRRGPASARSLNAVATLGVLNGHEIEVAATGPEAAEALEALRALAAEAFGDLAVEPAAAPAEPSTAAHVDESSAAPEGSLPGLPASPGVAIGRVRHFRAPTIELPKGPPGEPAEEWATLKRAIESAAAEIRSAREAAAARAGEQTAAIFDAHELFLDDEELLAPARAGILEKGLGAGAAWQSAVERAVESWRAIEDPYLRARAADVEAVGRQVLAHLSSSARARPILSGPGVLVASDLTPADTAGLDPEVVFGIATALGGPTSHSAVLARSLGIPAVVGLGPRIMEIEEGTTLVVDGSSGTVLPNPDAGRIAEARGRADAFRAAEAAARAEASEPAVTLDGTRVEVAANVGRLEDGATAVASGADGVGLLRTEFLFLGRDKMPTEEEQEAAYRQIAEILGGRPMILRTLDVGGDKPLPYLPQPKEANPFLGLRGLRLCLSQPEILRTQLRAALRVAADHPLRVMFPMVTTLEELLAAKALVEEAQEDLQASDRGTRQRLLVGMMVEVPAAAMSAATFAPHVDFFSIGTNDLAQYALAAERGNERVAGLADALHPAVLGMIRATVAAAEPLGRMVGACGELAADSLAVPLLIGLGVRELSASPRAVPRVKRAVRGVGLSSAREVAEQALGLDSAAAVRALAASAFAC